ncbi:MAG: anti-sigma regulatory factor [Bacillota bacterium]|jgi:serine/threonine-protein kinase RsbT|uniref:ATP-binding protein n=5 Tax=Fictibacillus TaxID=1329200 RepID=A0A1B1YZL9_9BACL|nr:MULTISPECIES: anti-sigma regulatory factor [Bacillaceae]ANC75553.1 serine/threonine protein kinase [Fictibacillus phosphorivorans]ANX10643.1 serine/threonine protein kinase [Fictibacillus arsenicus]MBH0158962.1 anti-sigma regulatory factor [Fictibacillus sp. 5RED26]MBH0167483.1 anti-sigma regulatory factor [Fictibacillus sp. 7GRE50]MBH0171821.1 anti-sigma regulatory factor [Fictibacillus sp. 18YEL24]
MDIQSCVEVRNEWDIVSARQLGRNMAKELGFGNVDQARITTAISELARNIYLYAGRGKICIEPIDQLGRKGLRIVALDNGPGIREIRKVMEDGYTTSGGLGAGLPGVKRLMDEFSIESTVDVGTEISATKWLR